MVDFDTRLRELEHRFRNILTIVRAVVSQSLQAAESLDDAKATIDDRLAALSVSFEQLLKRDWEATSLPELADVAMAHFTLYTDRIRFDGPAVTIGPKTAMTLTLAFHELATNAIKHGALSNDAGTIELTWKIMGSDPEAELWIQWAERDGPPVVRPERQGFGTRLICTAAGRSVQGHAELDFPASGVVWTLLAPLKAIGA